MTTYHLQARRTNSATPDRRREETRLVDAADLDTATRTARELAAEGFTVWIFRRAARPRLSATPHPLHLVTTIGPPEPEPGLRPAPGPAPGSGGRVVELPVARDEHHALRRAR
jgi:hypothetical protein